jgi:hypothetical protein
MEGRLDKVANEARERMNKVGRNNCLEIGKIVRDLSGILQRIGIVLRVEPPRQKPVSRHDYRPLRLACQSEFSSPRTSHLLSFFFPFFVPSAEVSNPIFHCHQQDESDAPQDPQQTYHPGSSSNSTSKYEQYGKHVRGREMHRESDEGEVRRVSILVTLLLQG